MPIRLDERLTEIARLANGACIVCDVGSDHGKLACRLVQTGGAERAIATDISAPSLKKAERLAEELGLADEVQTRIGDGLDPIADREADVVVIAGMGGDLIARILERARKQGKSFGRFVLSPNTHAERVREQLQRMGHTVVHDGTVGCAGKNYTVIATREGGEEKFDALQLVFGKFFAVDEEFRARAAAELAQIKKLLAENPAAAALNERKKLLEEALEECSE